MAMSYLNPDVAQTPEDLLLWAYENDRYHGTGLACVTLQEMLEAYGFRGEWMNKRPKRLRQELKDGHPIIAYVGPGTFTTNHHYILIYGIDPKDQVRVIDPNSPRKSQKLYPLEDIFYEITGSYAFLICSAGEE